MLTDRRAQILELIIAEYVHTATPVGSKSIVEKFDIGVSPATIRSEMAHLEDEGFITHPHTSAGRVPSDKGYRYYVEALMREQALSEDERRRIRHQFYQMRRAFEDWLDLAAAILAQSVQNVAVVTAPWSPTRLRLQQVQLVSIQDTHALLIVVLQDGIVVQHSITFGTPVTQDELSFLSARVNKLFAGLNEEEIRSSEVELTVLEQLVVDITLTLMREKSRRGDEEAHLEGIQNLLSQPEFSESKRILELLDVFDERTLPHRIPFLGVPHDGVTIVIGAENADRAMSGCSVMLRCHCRSDPYAIRAGDPGCPVHVVRHERSAGGQLRNIRGGT
jgi:heat-inducible transcriptional repressor